MIERIERDIGPLEAAVFNIGANVNFPILETTSRVYFKVWEMACFAGFLMGREAARHGAPAARVDLLHRRHRQHARPRRHVGIFGRRTRCARWRKAWRANLARRTSTWRT
jgi:hypothetical protein